MDTNLKKRGNLALLTRSSGPGMSSAERAAPLAETQQKKFDPKEKKEEIEIPQNPIFDKIRQTLLKTDPDKWRRAGEDLVPDQKHPKALDSWDQAFILDMKESVLVLRSTQPVKSDYFGGGFTISPTAVEQCFVEIRGKGWNLRELIDPYYRSTTRKDNKLQRLVEGTMAQILFREVKHIVESFSTERRKEFERECFELMADLPRLIKDSTYEAWERSDHTQDALRYSATIRGMRVELTRAVHEDRESYHLKMGKDGMYKTMTTSQTEDMFEAIENLGRDAKLLTLSKVLDTFDF